jgi:hypothetical protein
MTKLPKRKQIKRAVSVARIVLKVMYLNTFSQDISL